MTVRRDAIHAERLVRHEFISWWRERDRSAHTNEQRDAWTAYIKAEYGVSPILLASVPTEKLDEFKAAYVLIFGSA